MAEQSLAGVGHVVPVGHEVHVGAVGRVGQDAVTKNNAAQTLSGRGAHQCVEYVSAEEMEHPVVECAFDMNTDTFQHVLCTRT